MDHAAGAASPRPGHLEVSVDKRHAYDDGRGMGEGVLDSRPTRHRYVLLLEPAATAAQPPAGRILPALSPLALTLARQLESPLTIFLDQQQQQSSSSRSAGGGDVSSRSLHDIGEINVHKMSCQFRTFLFFVDTVMCKNKQMRSFKKKET